MKYTKRHTFFPECSRLLMIVFLLIYSFPLISSEELEKGRFEKIFKTLEMDRIEKTKFILSELPAEVVIVNFWASWCIPCLHEIPSLIEVSKKFTTKELAVVVINTDEKDQLENIRKIQKKLSFPESFIIVPDKKFKIADVFKFSAIPVTVIYKKGKVVYFNNGPVDFLKVPPNMW